jgi:hypothetical protein
MASDKIKKKIKQSKETQYLIRLHLIEELMEICGGNPGSISKTVKTTKKNGKRITRYYPIYQASAKVDPNSEPFDIKMRIRLEDVKAVNAMIKHAQDRQNDELEKRKHDLEDWKLRYQRTVSKIAKAKTSIEKEEKLKKEAGA